MQKLSENRSSYLEAASDKYQLAWTEGQILKPQHKHERMHATLEKLNT